MGKVYKEYLPKNASVLRCKCCHSHLTSQELLVSKAFQGKTGKAWLFDDVKNVYCGESETRQLLTGSHRVCDLYCKISDQIIGWKYISASQPDQKYKEGKYIIEISHFRGTDMEEEEHQDNE